MAWPDLGLAKPRVVVDGHVFDRVPVARRRERDRGGEREAVGEKALVPFHEGAAHEPEPRIDIGQPLAGEVAREAREEPLGGPSHERNVDRLSDPGSHDHLVVLRECEQGGDGLHRIRAVRVRDEDPPVLRALNAKFQGSAVAPVLHPPQHARTGGLGLHGRAVVRAIIHDDDLERPIGLRHRLLHGTHLRSHMVPFIVSRDHHGHGPLDSGGFVAHDFFDHTVSRWG